LFNPGQRVLEIGCGTGNLAILVKRLNPASQIVAIDPDPKPWPAPAAKPNDVGSRFNSMKASRRNCHIPTRRSTGFSPHSCFTMSDLMRRPFLCGRPFVSSRREAHYTSSISMRGNASSAASMDSWRASSIRVMARAHATPSSVSCRMPDSWTRARLPVKLLFWEESLTTKAFGVRPSLQRQNRIERATKGLKSSAASVTPKLQP
jgi:hypothetical protein